VTATANETRSTSFEPGEIVGRTEPRLWTRPLVDGLPGPCGCGCALDETTSYGFDVVRFATNTLRHPLDPWQRWVVIHAGELLPDGRPRFRKVLILVARQNGKTHLLVVLALYWLFIECVPMVLGTSTKLDYAAESWRKACRLARRVPKLKQEISHRGAIRKANGEQVLWRADVDELLAEEGSRYKIAASNEEGGRSLTIDRLVLDELRQHHDYSAHDAAVPATNAVPDAQTFALSNAGSEKSVVLNDMRAAALDFIESGEGDRRLGLFEWSAPDGSSPLDLHALAQANPNLGRYRGGRLAVDPEALLGDAQTAVAKGGQKLAGFKVENMCMAVRVMDPAIDPEAWARCLDDGDLAGVRSRVALCFDVSIDQEHAALVAAAVLPDGRVRVEPVAAWSGPQCMAELRRALPGHVERVRPRALGWFPSGPAAAVAADMAEDKAAGWPPAGVKVEQIRNDTTAVCMGFAALVLAEQVAQADDPMLTAQVLGAEKLRQGDAWRFTRRGVGHVSGVYAAAGATHLARTLPASVGKPRLVTGRKSS
jgi:hypothetical protein